MKNRIIILITFSILIVLILGIFVACKKVNSNIDDSSQADETVDKGGILFNYDGMPIATFVFQVEKGKELKVEVALFEDKAPETCKNFIKLAESGHYNGSIIHRLKKYDINDPRENIGIIQGGGYKLVYDEDGKGIITSLSSVEPIANEYNNNESFTGNNDLKNELGSLAMARTDEPKTTDQFYFNTIANSGFDNNYAVFGKCINTSSLDAIVEIGKAKTVMIKNTMFTDFPFPIITILRVEISKKPIHEG